MPLNIAYVLKMYPRFSETFIVNEILELERQGIDVRIYSLRKPDDGRFHADLARVKANVIYVPHYPQMELERIRAGHDVLRRTYPERYSRVRDYVLSRGHDFAIKRFLQAGYVAGHLLEHPVHAVHAHFASSATRVANLVYQLSGIPYSFTAHAKDIFHQDVRAASLRSKIRDARFVAAVSQFNRDFLRELMGQENADIRWLHNGLDLKRFRPPGERQSQSNLILGVGRLVEKKGFDLLIEACSLLQGWGLEFRCQIIGKGERREQLQTLILRHGLGKRVTLVGPKPQEKVRAAYRRAAVFALPCIVGRDGNRDGLPTVLLEAMATGLPVVSTSLTGVPEIIDHEENGLLVPPGDPHELALALAMLLGDPALSRRLGQAARRKVESHFDVRQNVAQLRQWLAEPVAEAPAWSERPAPKPVPLTEMPHLPAPTLQEALATL